MVKAGKVQTTIIVRRSTWEALRALAAERSLDVGGKPNASAVVEGLVAREVARREALRVVDAG